MKKSINKDILEDLYIKQNKCISDIAEYFDVSNGTITKRINEFQIQKKKPLWHYNDLNNKTFGCLKVVGYSGKTDKRGSRLWDCICECGYQHAYPTGRLTCIKPRKSCIKCKRKNPEHKKYKDISYRFWSGLIDRSSLRSIEFSVSLEEAWELFVNQNERCALSDLPIKFGLQNHQTASLDRIDSSLGYTLGNVQWVHKHINYMKWKLSEKEFIELCGKVWNHKK